MKNNKLIIIIATVLCASMLFTSCGAVDFNFIVSEFTASNNNKSYDQSGLSKAADFTVYDSLGNPKSLSEFKGKPVVLNFWASWCGYCKQEMPQFDEAYKKYGEDVQFLMVDLTDGRQETQKRASSYLSGSGFTFPVYFDLRLNAAEAYNIHAVPKTFLIDSDGYIVEQVNGAVSDGYLDDKLPKLK